jgi:cation diffusion facilitator family transporter
MAGAGRWSLSMRIQPYRVVSKRFIKDFDDTESARVRVEHGLLAGWISIITTVGLFGTKMVLGLLAGSISVIADAFHLLSHLANSVILVVSFRMTSRPATAKTPFGHGRMEHVAPLIMSVFLFVSGIQIGERALHQVMDPHPVHYWPALPWVLLTTVVIKGIVGHFVRYLGRRVASHAILTNAFHHRVEAAVSLTVIAGLIVEHRWDLPAIDGVIGIAVAVLLLYLGFRHGREAVIPILGEAPSRSTTERIRTIAGSIEGVEGVHEIIVHDYGSMYLISLHVEVPEKFGPAQMHEIAERCEGKLRKVFGGEVVCHTDPLLEKTPELLAIEERFKEMVAEIPEIVDYHDFRVVAESPSRIIIVADLDVAYEVPVTEFESVASRLEDRVKKLVPNVAYASFYVTPKFAY